MKIRKMAIKVSFQFSVQQSSSDMLDFLAFKYEMKKNEREHREEYVSIP